MTVITFMSFIPFILLSAASRNTTEKISVSKLKKVFLSTQSSQSRTNNCKMSTSKSTKDDRVYENSNMVRRKGLSCVFIWNEWIVEWQTCIRIVRLCSILPVERTCGSCELQFIYEQNNRNSRNSFVTIFHLIQRSY